MKARRLTLFFEGIKDSVTVLIPASYGVGLKIKKAEVSEEFNLPEDYKLIRYSSDGTKEEIKDDEY